MINFAIMKRNIHYLILLAGILLSGNLFAQEAPFEISLESLTIKELGGIQSYAFAQDSGKWLIVGGRLDGLHQRQPFAAFDIAGHNNQLIVVDPISKQKWSAALSSLPTAIVEHLSSTNMEFYQEGNYLYCLGGYGYSATLGDHTTFDKLTAIKVSEVIKAVVNKNSFTSYFRQITDAKFQVTGGKLKKIDANYYLLGGQKFLGRYNPMGPGHGAGFTQEYTDAIRIFSLVDNGSLITIKHLPSYSDANNLHRRDYNAEPQILTDGSEGITMFSGVFQKTANVPFLNSVTVNSKGFTVNNNFKQYYNHYHCPVLPLYSIAKNEMHTVFFGGIAQYYDNAGTLVQDNNVPFVNTIARVTRDKNGTMKEYKLPIEMPSLLGAGAEFIPNRNFPQFKNDVFQLDSLDIDSVLIGYIYGGISSSAPNIFFSNNGTESNANNKVFKVYLKKNTTLSIDELNTSSTSVLNLLMYPNPTKGNLNIEFDLKQKEDVLITVTDINGSLFKQFQLSNTKYGNNKVSLDVLNLTKKGIYLVSLETKEEKVTRKLVLKSR